jgi:REP element-mobilizing transposase RayT
MSHSCSRNTIHLVLSTKDRAKTITPQLQPKLCAFIVGICKNENIYVLAIGGAQDHIHILLQLPPIVSLAKLTPHQIKFLSLAVPDNASLRLATRLRCTQRKCFSPSSG